MTALDPVAIRAAYPALAREHAGRPLVWACGPGGTQVPQAVIDAMGGYLRRGVSNLHGPFPASAESDAVLDAARAAGARLVGSDDPETVHFGLNTTSLHFHLAHALGREWNPGDAIVVTSLDHDANVRPWIRAAEERGVIVRTWRFRTDDGRLHVADLEPLLDQRVRLVAVTAAANALGSVIDLPPIAAAAHAVEALVVVDAVHLAPHRALDVAALGCDALTCSAYKCFGPHLGIQWLRRDLAERLPVDKVLPSPDTGGGRWEQGTVNLEALAGFSASVDHLAGLGGGRDRAALVRAFDAITAHERALTTRFIDGAANIRGLRLHGTSDPQCRTPTFGCTVDGWHAEDLARTLADRGITTWAGHFYALGVIADLGLTDVGGLLRIGFVHNNTVEEVDRVVAALAEIVT